MARQALVLFLTFAVPQGQDGDAELCKFRDANPCGDTMPTLNFKDAEVVHSNLGGQGPDDGPEEMLYHNLGNLPDGTPIGLKITTEGGQGYEAADSNKNGLNDGMAQINLLNNRVTSLRFQFVDERDDSDICVGQGGMTFYDVDGERHESPTQEYEVISVCPPADRTVPSDCYLPPNNVPTGLEKVTAATPNMPFPVLPIEGCDTYKAKAPITNVLDPEDPDQLNPEQLSHTITHHWDDLCNFVVFFGTAHGNVNEGRNFWFTGTAKQSITCTACEETCDICKAGDTCLEAISCKADEIEAGGDSNLFSELPEGKTSCSVAQAAVNAKCPQCAECERCPGDPPPDVVPFEEYEVAARGSGGAPAGRGPFAAALGALAAVSGMAMVIAGLRRRAFQPLAAAPDAQSETDDQLS